MDAHKIASDVVKIFIPQDARPCQEKILYLQREDPLLHARNALKHGDYTPSTGKMPIVDFFIEWVLGAAQLRLRAVA